MLGDVGVENILKSFGECYDASPFAFTVIEVLKDESGKAYDFVSKYINDACAAIIGAPRETLTGKKFYQFFNDADKKWLDIYSDVAFNGASRSIVEYSPEIKNI